MLAAFTALAMQVAPAPSGSTDPPDLAPPEQGYVRQEPARYPSLEWLVLQGVPSAEIAIGRDPSHGGTAVAGGLRWQLTPVMWSFGTHRSLNRWRFFVVDPLSRVSGSIALETHFEYIGGFVDKALARPALAATFPVLHRGEYLAVSLGTSVYRFDDRTHVTWDVGAYMLYGILGIQANVAPEHEPLRTIAVLRFRYF